MKIRLKNPFRVRKKTIISISIGILIGLLIGFAIQEIRAQSVNSYSGLSQAKELSVIQGNSVLSVSEPALPYKSVQHINMVITAYSSTPWQTDSTPFITASGDTVKDGIVANNLLPFGTEIRMPELYGDKVFVVQDRMHWRMGYYRLDIWFPETQEAKNFGKKSTKIEVLED